MTISMSNSAHVNSMPAPILTAFSSPRPTEGIESPKVTGCARPMPSSPSWLEPCWETSWFHALCQNNSQLRHESHRLPVHLTRDISEKSLLRSTKLVRVHYAQNTPPSNLPHPLLLRGRFGIDRNRVKLGNRR